ncbi:hypothetical protein ACR6C2_01620 [Streptomyces sp. INA 01156]
MSALLGFGMFAGFAFLPSSCRLRPRRATASGARSRSPAPHAPSALAMFAVGFATAPLVRRFGPGR